MELLKQFPVAQQSHVLAVNSFLCDLKYFTEPDENGETMPIAYRVTIEAGNRSRSLEQNSLAWKWHVEAATQLKDETADDKRAYCKLHFGIPILREGSEEFRQQYDKVIKPHNYETKLAFMKTPIDFPVTSLMGVRQMSRYLDACYRHYHAQGVRLTNPEEYGEKAA